MLKSIITFKCNILNVHCIRLDKLLGLKQSIIATNLQRKLYETKQILFHSDQHKRDKLYMRERGMALKEVNSSRCH